MRVSGRLPVTRRKWTPEVAAFFARLWQNGAPLARFRREFGLSTAGSVQNVAKDLRRAGYVIARRPMGRRERRPL